MTKGWRGVEHRELHTKDAAQHPWIFRCPQPNCYWAVSAATEEIARVYEREHECPYQGGITHIAGSITVTLVEDMWVKADAAFKAMNEDDLDPDEFQRRRGTVRGMCEMIAIFMVPHFRTANEIGKELLKRAAAFEAGEDYETPGLLGRRYEAPPESPTRAYTRQTPVDSVAAPKKNAWRELSDAEVNAIKFAIDSGAFTVDQVAKTYGLPKEQVTSVSKS